MGLVGRWSQVPVADYAIMAGVLGGYRLARSAGLDPAVVQPGSQRTEIYQGAIGVAAAVLAFVVVPAAIVLALAPGRRVRTLLRRYPDDLRRATVAGGAAGLVTLAMGVAALALDAGDAANDLVRHLLVLVFGVMILSAARVIDIFSALLKTIAVDTKARAFDPAVSSVTPVKVPKVSKGVEVQSAGSAPAP